METDLIIKLKTNHLPSKVNTPPTPKVVRCVSIAGEGILFRIAMINKLPRNYFPHDFNARDDRKILRLRKVLGCEGYGIYWMLIEVLSLEPDFCYPIADIDLLSDRFGTSKEKVEAVVKQFDLFVVDKQANFFSISLIARLQKYLELSEKARIGANARWEKARKLKEMDANALKPHSERYANKRKEEKRKENESEEMTTHPLFSYWNSTLYTPRILEQEFILELVNQFGEKHAKKLIRKFAEKRFHALDTMRNSLDKNGNIKRKGDDAEPKHYNTDPLAGTK